MLIISFSQRRFMFRQWSLPKYFASKAKWVLRRYYIFLAAGNKKFQRANATTVRVWCKWIHPTIGSRKDEHGIHKHVHGSCILYCVSRVRSKTMDSLFCIMSLKLLYTIPYVKSIWDSFYLGNFAHSFIRLPPRITRLREAARSLAKTVKLKAFIYKEGERKTKNFVVLNYIKHQIVASISKHFSYLAIFWYFN